MSEREQELRATMLAAILAQGIPLVQAMQDADAAVRYVLGDTHGNAPRRKSRDVILSMWEAGSSSAMIARHLGMSTAGVFTAIQDARKAGDPRAVRRNNLSPDQIEKKRAHGRKYGGLRARAKP